jgi:hypothetical protein
VHEPKNDPAVVVRLAYDGLLAAEYEVLADEFTVVVKAGLAANIEDLYPNSNGSDSPPSGTAASPLADIDGLGLAVAGGGEAPICSA